VGVADMSLADVVERQVVMPTFSGGANAFPQVSPDGKWLAAVVTSPNNQNVLNIYNLADPAVAPIVLEAGSAGDTISSFAFTNNSQRLIVVAGGDKSANNALIGVDLATGNNFRISRGRFGSSLAVSPDGSQVAVLDWTIPEDPKEPAYTSTVIINIDNSEKAELYTGMVLGADGKIDKEKLTFIAPLVWKRG
ncbi:MAG: hypothetical protein K8I30_03090, partial [Anaerolineae bacterium]|nr:hypothetical protein [Anaerolineae bacterium]